MPAMASRVPAAAISECPTLSSASSGRPHSVGLIRSDSPSPCRRVAVPEDRRVSDRPWAGEALGGRKVIGTGDESRPAGAVPTTVGAVPPGHVFGESFA